MPDAATTSTRYGDVYSPWQVVDAAAISIAEIGPRADAAGRRCENGKPVPVDRADWKQYVQGVVDAGRAAYRASQTRSQDAVSDATNSFPTPARTATGSIATCQPPRCAAPRPIEFRRSKVEVRSYNPARFVPLKLSEEIPMARALARYVVALLVLTGSASAQWITDPPAAHTQDSRRKAEHDRLRAAHA